MAGHPGHSGEGAGLMRLQPAETGVSWVNFSLMASHRVALMIKDDLLRHGEDKLQKGNG